MATKKYFNEVHQILKDSYPDAHCALNHNNAYELLVATILSAQCTDERVNKVTPELFKAFPDTRELKAGEVDAIREKIKSINFLNNKAKSLKGMGTRVEDIYKGEIPDTIEDLITLPGVARKTANVVLSNIFGKNEGVVVDTHVSRISQRLGLTKSSNTAQIEKDLMKLCPQEDWGMLSHLFIDHGRAICDARKPKCGQCPMKNICKWKEKRLYLDK